MLRSALYLCTFSAGSLIAAQPARAQEQAPATPPSTADAQSDPAPRAAPPPAKPRAAGSNIVITGRRLDVARDSITPSLGASQYTFDREALQKQPGGTNLTLNKSLLQAPGVVQDSYGTIHIRNEHANLQYRLNGVIVPESISGFGTTFDPKIASSIQLITGTLPAQYGYRTAGVINFKTESGLLGNGGEAGIYGGSFNWLEPSAMIKGSSGKFSYFLSGSYFRNDLGIENPLPSRNAIHDRTTQYRPFAYFSDVLSDDSRIAVFGGSFIGHFQIPNVTGIGNGFTVNGVSSFDAAKLDQNQREITHYGVATYQYAGDKLNFQVAPFIRYSQTRFTTDPNHGDIIFNGFADAARLSSLAAGVQADGSFQVGKDHTARFGIFFENEHTTSNIVSSVLPVDANGDQTSDVPSAINDMHSKTGQLYGLYLQDEWKLSRKLTLNYGARFDIVRAYTRESQLSPRANLVWNPAPLTTLHIGYARNFTPPPQELIAPSTLALYNGTTKQPVVQLADPVKAEREHYFDGGFEQRFKGGFKLGLDGYYKIKRNLLDEGQFGSGLILSPFNYSKGYAWGVELSGNYTHGPLDLYANLARGAEKGKDIISSQYFFAPNGAALPGYWVFNAGISQNFDGPGALKGVTIRADVLNLFDKMYQIRGSSGVGVGAPQWGQRRGLFIGISKKFG